MAQGNKILLEGNGGRGHCEWGPIGDTSYPGTVMQIDTTPVKQGGRWQWIAANPGTAGLDIPKAILLDDNLQGFLPGTAYVAGRMGAIYFPLSGENMNVLSTEGTGTGQTFTVGENMIIKSTGGKIIPTTGSPMAYFCQSLEAIHEAGDYLLWVMMI